MKSSSVYYDDHSHLSTDLAQKFAERNAGTVIIPASQVKDPIIYEHNEKVGFIFASVKGKLPESIENLLKRIVADKQAYIFAFVTGGNHEIRVIKQMQEILRQRGMSLDNAYAECLMQKFSADEELQLQKIESDVQMERRLLEEFHDQMESMPVDDMKKKMKKDIRQYFRDIMKKF